jgi:hypothetical protein
MAIFVYLVYIVIAISNCCRHFIYGKRFTTAKGYRCATMAVWRRRTFRTWVGYIKIYCMCCAITARYYMPYIGTTCKNAVQVFNSWSISTIFAPVGS